jgi:TonB family protein
MNISFSALTVLIALIVGLTVPAQEGSKSFAKPRVSRMKAPAYPAIAHSARANGPVTVEIEIARSGSVGSVRVISGHPLFYSVSAKAAREWKFEPVQEVLRTNLTFDFVDSFGLTTLPADMCREGYVVVDPYHLKIYGYKKVGAAHEFEDRVSEEIEGTFCEVHRREILRRDRVKIVYGLVGFKPGFLEAEENVFPNANSAADGGCIIEVQLDPCSGKEIQVSPKYAEVLYCPVCRRAEKQWSKSHPWPNN